MRACWFSLCLALSACSVVLSDLNYRSIMPIDADGHMVDVKTDELEQLQAPVTHESRARAHARAMVEAMLAPNAGKALIYLHGGLNRVSATSAAADDLLVPMRKAGYHPILINWDSAFGPAYRKHLVRSKSGRPSTAWDGLTAPATVLWDVAATTMLAPKALYSALSDSLHSNVFFHKKHWYELLGETPVCTREGAAQSRSCRVDHSRPWTHDWPTGWDRFQKASWWWATSPLRLAFTPVVDRLGRDAWTQMLRNTRNLFNPEATFDAHKDEGTDSGALAIFLDELAKRLDHDKRPLQITIVAHSMGAILADEILRRYMHHPLLVFDQIVYLAAASSTRDSMHAIHNYLEAQPEAHFYAVTLHPFAEDRERRAGMLAPDGSLLVWVDSMFEPSRHFLDRRFGRWENLKPVLPYLLREEGFGHTADTDIRDEKIRALKVVRARPELQQAAQLSELTPPASPIRDRMHFTVEGFFNSPQWHNQLNKPEHQFWCPGFWVGNEVPPESVCAPQPSRDLSRSR